MVSTALSATLTGQLVIFVTAQYNEILNMPGNTLPNLQLSPLPVTNISVETIPVEFDWYKLNHVTRILNQNYPQYCGSSWAHSTMSAFADRVKIARSAQGVSEGPEINFAIQVLLNCGGEVAGNCSGGSTSGAYDMVHQLMGIPYETCQPYEAKDTKECNAAGICQTCSPSGCEKVITGGLQSLLATTTVPNATISEWGQVTGETNIQREILARGPVVCHTSNEVLLSYRSGILDNHSNEPYNHAVSVTGWGVEVKPDGTFIPYWRVRNSWGEFWGETGFFRVLRNPNSSVLAADCDWAQPESWVQQSLEVEQRHKTMRYDSEKVYNYWMEFTASPLVDDDEMTSLMDGDNDVLTAVSNSLLFLITGETSTIVLCIMIGVCIGFLLASVPKQLKYNWMCSRTESEPARALNVTTDHSYTDDSEEFPDYSYTGYCVDRSSRRASP